MFGFLKKKLKETVDKFTKKAKDEAVEVEDQELTEQDQAQLQEEEQILEQEAQVEEQQEVVEESAEEPVEEEPEPEPEPTPEEEPVVEDIPEEKTEEPTTETEPEEISEEVDEQVTAAAEELAEELPEQVDEEPETTDADPNELSEEELDTKLDALDAQEDVAKEISEPVEESKEEPEDVPEVPVEKKTEEVIEEQQEVIEEPVEESIEEPAEEPKKKKGFFGKLFGKKDKDVDLAVEETPVREEPQPTVTEEPIVEEKTTPVVDDEVILDANEDVSEESPAVEEKSEDPVIALEEAKDVTKKKKGFFGKLREKVVKFKLTEEAFEELFWEFELAMLENNVAVEVIEKIKQDMHERLTQENVSRRGIEAVIMQTLKGSLSEILDIEPVDLLGRIKDKKPFSIAVIGVNGAGKTTAIGKLIKLFQNKNLSVVVAASDTFRAAAIQQLEEHTTKLDVKLIKHDYGADPSAVAYDAIKHANAKGIDVVIIDTAGRLQSNSNLMDELKKLIRVNTPDFKLFVGESITGNDCVEQAVAFNEAVGIDGILLSKADVDDKGGAAISVSHVTQKPILYLGTGQTYDDLEVFDKAKVLSNLGL